MHIFTKLLDGILNKKRYMRLYKDANAGVEQVMVRFGEVNIISKDDLLDGDFIFCRPSKNLDKLNKQSKIIQSFTGGYYTHTAIYIGDNKVIHAVKPRVEECDLDKLLDNYDYLVIVRVWGNDEERFSHRRKKIVNFAKEQVGKKYNTIGAIFAPKKEDEFIIAQYDDRVLEGLIAGKPLALKEVAKKIPPRKLFCSQLLVESLVACEYIPKCRANRVIFQPEYWTPNGLAKYGNGNFFQVIGLLSDNQQTIDKNDYFYSGYMEREMHGMI